MSRDIAPFGLRMPPELKESLKEEADRNGRSLNAEIVYRLEMAMESSRSVAIAADGTALDTARETLLAGKKLAKDLLESLDAGLQVMEEKAAEEQETK
ncbi:Arc family DNA-binding protein [Endothiovibrio diazotrophicus]